MQENLTTSTKTIDALWRLQKLILDTPEFEEVVARVVNAILTESALSYLGLGILPPTPSWGNLLTNATTYFVRAWWLVVSPGVMIFLTVLCLYLIGDGLRDALDPRLKTEK